MKHLRFNPTISFDGVAIIIGVITLAVGFGQMKQQLASNAKQLSQHDEQLRKLSESTAMISGLLAARENAYQMGPPLPALHRHEP